MEQYLETPDEMNIINPYRFAGGGGSYILDDVAGSSGGWSVSRQLRSAYSGAAIRVRRSSDNAEQDIGFTAGILDESELETFGSGTDCYITTIYNQSAGAFDDMVQGTAGSQPQIVVSGAMNKDANGNAYAAFDGVADRLNIADSYNAPWTIYSVFEGGGSLANNDRIYGAGSAWGALRWRTSNTELIYDNNASSISLGTALADSTLYMFRHGTDLTNITAVVNNGTEETAASTDSTSRSGFAMGSASTNYANVNFFEMLFYESDVTANDSTVQSSINDQYSIW